MIEASVFRIMIGCPSDIQEEVQVARNVILDWTCKNVEATGIALLPLHWSTDSYSSYGSHPQKILDKQLVEKSDMLVCLFGSKVGTPTDTSESGSIEEIEEHVKKGKPVMIFFKKEIDITTVNPIDLQKLQDFKRRISGICKWDEYENAALFKDIFSNKLEHFVNDNWRKENCTEHSKVTKPHISDVFTDYEKNMFAKWANNKVDQMYSQHRMRYGLEVHMGYQNGFVLQNAQQEAEFEDLMNRLVEYGLIKESHNDNHGNPVYKITKQGYDFARDIHIV